MKSVRIAAAAIGCFLAAVFMVFLVDEGTMTGKFLAVPSAEAAGFGAFSFLLIVVLMVFLGFLFFRKLR